MFACSTRFFSEGLRSGSPSGASFERSGLGWLGSPVSISRALLAVPQTGAKCTQQINVEFNQNSAKSRLACWVKSMVTTELRTDLDRILSTPYDCTIPCCLATEQSTAMPAKNSIMKTSAMCTPCQRLK